MGTFKDSLKNWFYTQGTQAANENARIPLLDGNGNPIGSDTIGNIVTQQPLFTGNVGIVSYLESNSYPTLLQPTKENFSEKSVGVWVYSHGKILIIAKSGHISLPTATSNVQLGTTNAATSLAAIQDMNGKTKTAAFVNTLGDNAKAAYYCYNYYPTGFTANDKRFGANQWWLPSAGELLIMWAHYMEIKKVMSAIGGEWVDTKNELRILSSTERSADYAWFLRPDTGVFSYNYKTETGRVIPVTTINA